MSEADARTLRLADGRGGSVAGRAHAPQGESPPPSFPTLLLTHGAGGNLDTPGLVALAQALALRGIRTVRFNLPAAEAGRKRPDRPAVAMGAIAAVLRWAVDASDGPVFLGGRSFGGRMASMLLADPVGEASRRVAGAVFLAYPLKPPGKPEVPAERVEHLDRISIPMLFVSGDRDPFAPPALLDPVAAAAGAQLAWIAGGDHGFRVPKALLAASARTAADVRDEVAGAVAAFIAANALSG